MENLSNYSVCIVSYAKYMENKKMGKIINKYDKVVRINNGINILNLKDFGMTTHIASLYFAGGKNRTIVNTYNLANNVNERINVIDLLHKYNIKDLLFFVNRDNISKNDIIKNGINILFNKEFTVPYLTTGLYSIISILCLKPKELLICGFDFTMNLHSDYEYYYKIFRKFSNRLNKTYDECEGLKHSTLFEKYILKKLWIDFKFTVDDVLQKILEDYDISLMDNNYFEINGENIGIYKELYEKIFKMIET